LLVQYVIRLLCLVDPRNCNNEKIEQDKVNVVAFIYHLLEETVSGKLQALVEESKEQESTVFQQLDIADDTDFGGDIVTQLLRKQNESQKLNIDEDEKRKELEECLKGEICKELDHFLTYCSTTALHTLLKNHPTKKYCKELVQEAKDRELKILPAKVNKGLPSYAATRFDILHWWQHMGKTVYPKLAIGAPIILGKPAHNGYQERVFSNGKYCDNTLRNRMRPENFEMRVLDTVNRHNDGIKSFTQLATTPTGSKYVKEFFTSGNLKLVLKLPPKANGSIDDGGNVTDTVGATELPPEPPIDPEYENVYKSNNPVPKFADDDEEEGDLENPFNTNETD
jgi:hAT family C-terminal dimerisation region